MSSSIYRGRFAPSPTGPLHFGSLVAAVGSYLSACRAGGEWLVRIEDLDPPREVPGSAEQIVAALETLGFQWTQSIIRQSERVAHYREALERLLENNCAYPCSCSRTELRVAQPPERAADDELYYPGWCRDGVRAPERACAIRFRVSPGETAFNDLIQGMQTIAVATDVGDFVIRRRDGLFAYQLAVVVDDAAQGITHVVRGMDLLTSTARQIQLLRALGFAIPKYAHLPVATDAQGIKLSKSKGAAAIDLQQPARELWRALCFLRQDPPPELSRAAAATVWEWALEYWHEQPLRGVRHIPVYEPAPSCG